MPITGADTRSREENKGRSSMKKSMFLYFPNSRSWRNTIPIAMVYRTLKDREIRPGLMESEIAIRNSQYVFYFCLGYIFLRFQLHYSARVSAEKENAFQRRVEPNNPKLNLGIDMRGWGNSSLGIPHSPFRRRV